MMNEGDKKAWIFIFQYYDSNKLRDIIKVIEEIIEKREEFFK
jgi:hypothetical protein